MSRRFCSGGGHSAGSWGISLMVLGILLLILSLPYWLWVGLLGLILLGIGFLLLRFG